MTNCHEVSAVLPGSPRQIIGSKELLPGEPGKLWRTKVQEKFSVLLQPLFVFAVCFVVLTEQERGFMQGVLWLVTVAEAALCCVVVLDTRATACHVILFQAVYIRKHRQSLLKAG